MLEFSDMIVQTGELVSENVIDQARQVCPVLKTSYTNRVTENVREAFKLSNISRPFTYYVQVLTNMGHVLEAAGVSFNHGNYQYVPCVDVPYIPEMILNHDLNSTAV